MAWPGLELAPNASPIMEITLTSATQPLNDRYAKIITLEAFLSAVNGV